MNKEIVTGVKPTEKETFSFSKDLDGVKKTIRGEEVENGWIITIEKEWEDKNPITDTSEWKYNTWKYISKENPLKKLQQDPADTSDEADIKSAISSVTNSEGMLLID